MMRVIFAWLAAVAAEPTIDDFNLPDPQAQQTVSLSNLTAEGPVVLIFLSTDCPVSRRYMPRLVEARESYRPFNVQFVGIDPNPQDTPAKIERFVKDFEINFPILKDFGGVVAENLKAKRTPHVFLIDANRLLRYSGRIDDQIHLGYERASNSNTYLTSAIEDVLSNKPVRVAATEPSGCLIDHPRSNVPTVDIEWKEVAPIFARHCLPCHRSRGSAPFSLARHADLEGRLAMIEESITEGNMPPWPADPNVGVFENANFLSTEDKSKLIQWLQSGAPAGKSLVESPATDVADWQLPRPPDLVLSIHTSPLHVPAEGRQDFRRFLVDPHFESARWISAAQINPGNPTVLRHACVYIVPPGLVTTNGLDIPNMDDVRVNLLTTYSPGTRCIEYPPGIAKELPAGSRFVFEVLYRCSGKEEEDLTQLGLNFIDPRDVKRVVKSIAIAKTNFTLQPGDANFVTQQQWKIPVDSEILSLTPHLHGRGRSMSVQAVSRTARNRLLEIPHYAFHWQPSYLLTEPMPVPSGTMIECVARFDNSPGNRLNPDAEALVKAGDSVDDEILMVHLDLLGPPLVEAAEVVVNDPTSNITLAIAGLGLTTAFCLFLLWLKPAGTPAFKPQVVIPESATSEPPAH